MVWKSMDGAFRDTASPEERRRQVNTEQVVLEFVPQDIRLEIHLTRSRYRLAAGFNSVFYPTTR